MPGSPTITGTHTSDTINGAPVTPFTGVTVSDPVVGATETLSFYALGLANNITLTDGADYTGLRTLTSSYVGQYQITGTAAQVTQELDALVFTATTRYPGDVDTVQITLDDSSSSNNYVYDQNTQVINSTPPDTVSLSSQVTFKNGVFTLTGTASSVVGVKYVGFQAMVDGSFTNLGKTKVNADGSFTFKDRVGPHTQSYITAVEVDGIDYNAPMTTPPISLTGGLDQDGVVAEQDGYTPDGSALTSVSHFQPDGVHTTDVLTPGQTLSADYTDTFNADHQGNSTFVYNPGHGSNVVTEFRLRGAQHDTLSFASADFDNSIAYVLRHAQATPGGVTLHDPTSGDTVQIAGITKAALVRNQGDIAFHT